MPIKKHRSSHNSQLVYALLYLSKAPSLLNDAASDSNYDRKAEKIGSACQKWGFFQKKLFSMLARKIRGKNS